MNRRSVCVCWLVLLVIFQGASLQPGGADEPGRQGKKKLTKADIDGMMTSLSNWGRWGKDDQRGALNLITPEKRRRAAALVQEGVPIPLAHAPVKEPLDSSPAFLHRMVALPAEGQEIASAADE